MLYSCTHMAAVGVKGLILTQQKTVSKCLVGAQSQDVSTLLDLCLSSSRGWTTAFDTRRRFITSLVTAAVSDERQRSAHLLLVEVPAHHSAPSSAALAEGSRADCIQTFSPGVQVSTRVRTCIPY